MNDDSKIRFVKLLAAVDEKTLIGAAIIRHLNANTEIDQLIVCIREMAADNPQVIDQVIGYKAVRMLRSFRE